MRLLRKLYNVLIFKFLSSCITEQSANVNNSVSRTRLQSAVFVDTADNATLTEAANKIR